MSFLDRGDPDFINEKGVKWWREELLTHCAHQENINGTRLPDVVVCYVEHPDGTKNYVLIRDQEVIYETQSYEQIGFHIDVLKLQTEYYRAVADRLRE
jgi:hypothetical protein